MDKINYIIKLECNNRKSRKIEKKIKKSISKLGCYIFNLLKDIDICINICDILYHTNIQSTGCYFLNEHNGKVFANIYIDSKTKHNIKNTFYHEIGHLIDDIVGCLENKVSFTKENAKIYKFSQTNNDFIFFNKIENDFFTQIKRNDFDDFTFFDLRESFANSFADMVIGKRNMSMVNIKHIIYQVVEKHSNKCKMGYNKMYLK